MIEHRRHPRVPLNLSIELTPKGQTARVSASAKDISLGGMFIETTEVLAHNAELTVHVTLPGQPAPFALTGKVRWTRPDGMGVQFGVMGARETHAITEYARKNGG